MDGVHGYEPTPRWGHTSVTIGDRVYMWGGRTEDFSESSKKELSTVVEVFGLPDQCWEQKKTKGKPPLGLYNNAATAIGGDIYVYGGWDGHVAHNTLHQLHADTLTWKEMGAGDVDELPMKMSGCGLVAFGSERLVLFGGYGLPSTTKASSKPAGKKVNLVTISSKSSTQSTTVNSQNSSVDEGGVKLLGVKLKSDVIANEGSDSFGEGSDGGTRVVLVNGDSELGGTATEEVREEGEKEEEGEEVSALIDKQWTNELKVYDLQNGTWSSPEMSGDCPPPCADFSFDCIDGRMAVLFGGYRPESGASSGAYLLDMELWHWTKLGDYETTEGRLKWPAGRDGHASCILSETPHPQILISGGWDKDNTLLNDGWILDVQRRLWKRFSIPDAVGPRLWHRMVSYKYSPMLRQLLFFGGCPCAPMDDVTGASWEKLASTILMEIGHVKMPNGDELQRYRPNHHKSEGEWVVVDSLPMELMGAAVTCRIKERLLIAEYRAVQAEAQALKAEKIARDTLHKLETALSRLGKGANLPQLTDPASLYTSDSASASQSQEEKQPFWVISRSNIHFTAEELGRGRWGLVKVAEYKGERVAARCLYSQIASEENREVFIKDMDMAARLHHQNILPLVGAVLEGEPVMIMELMPSNLRKVLDDGKLYNYQIATLALDIAAGLLFLHTTRPDPVLHGDIATAGVLVQKGVSNHWRAKLSDFMTARFFRSRIVSSENDLDREDSLSPGHERGVFTSPPRSTTPRITPPPLSMLHRSGKISGSDDDFINRRLSTRKQSQTAPDMLDTATLTLQRDVYCFGLVLVEICTGTPPLEVSFQFLTESITWSEMSGVVKLCTEHIPSNRPNMEAVLNKVKLIHRATTSRPSKFNMTVAS